MTDENYDKLSDVVCELRGIDAFLDALTETIDHILANDEEFTSLWRAFIPPSVVTISYETPGKVNIYLQNTPEHSDELVGALEGTLDDMGDDEGLRFYVHPSL